jgi:hypothetical protein
MKYGGKRIRVLKRCAVVAFLSIGLFCAVVEAAVENVLSDPGFTNTVSQVASSSLFKTNNVNNPYDLWWCSGDANPFQKVDSGGNPGSYGGRPGGEVKARGMVQVVSDDKATKGVQIFTYDMHLETTPVTNWRCRVSIYVLPNYSDWGSGAIVLNGNNDKIEEKLVVPVAFDLLYQVTHVSSNLVVGAAWNEKLEVEVDFGETGYDGIMVKFGSNQNTVNMKFGVDNVRLFPKPPEATVIMLR